MGCPQCQSDEISPSGVCLICGYRIPAAKPKEAESEAVREDDRNYSGMIEIDYSEGKAESSEKSEIPEWRQQLSQRLHEIKQRKEMAATSHNEAKPPVTQAKAESLSALQARLLEKMPVRKPPAPPVAAPRQKTLEPLKPEPVTQAVPRTDPQEIRTLIDNAVSRQASPMAGPGAPAQEFETTGLSGYVPELAEGEEGKLILLSRTLAGLVDLIVVLLCTGAFIIAADVFSGVISLDYISLIIFSALFLLNYFVYSLFFLSASSQTIGMMMTDLRVVGMDERRPSTGRLVGRCCGHLLSVFGLGIGLLLSLFSRESLCFHDWLSGTRVVRV
jgi:uncharacterized RDD family membrane protein YckC/uncharacterized Zn finger protein (UPF0148 family)